MSFPEARTTTYPINRRRALVASVVFVLLAIAIAGIWLFVDSDLTGARVIKRFGPLGPLAVGGLAALNLSPLFRGPARVDPEGVFNPAEWNPRRQMIHWIEVTSVVKTNRPGLTFERRNGRAVRVPTAVLQDPEAFEEATMAMAKEIGVPVNRV